MPIISPSTYRPPAWLRGAHLQTIHPALFRKVAAVTTRRERLELEDGDFLDLEWSGGGSKRLAILSHGLEGSTEAIYIQAMARALMKRGWDVLAWNMRGCGEEPNRLAHFYHSGRTEDLEIIIRHALSVHPAEGIDLIGFSLGGNLTLKYLGERGSDTHPKIRRAVAFSAPCDLACCSASLGQAGNAIYMERFMKTLRAKVREKHGRFPERFDLSGLEKMRTFADFDGRFTAPLNGFRDAEDYWKRSSSRPFLPAITIPTLLVNALNDPFLGPSCYPREEAEASDRFHLEIPAEGGHVGFGAGREYWSETRAAEFLAAP
jgi:predicted alpha/beta-fold hydrolase